MKRRALRHVGHVDFESNLTVFLGLFGREAVLRAGLFIILLFWLDLPKIQDQYSLQNIPSRVEEFASLAGRWISASILKHGGALLQLDE